MVRPVLVAAGSNWEATGTGIAVEHLIWLSRPDPDVDLAATAAAHRRVRVLVGGSGWDGVDAGRAVHCGSLGAAVGAAAAAWGAAGTG